MVSTKLFEIGSKGTDYLYRSPLSGHDRRQSVNDSTRNRQPPPGRNPSSEGVASISSNLMSAYFKYATDSLQYAADSTYSSLNDLFSSLYVGETGAQSQPTSFSKDIFRSPSRDASIDFERIEPIRRSSSNYSFRMSSKDLRELLKNPYNSVRGRQPNVNSMSAVRSLLSLVPIEEQVEEDDEAKQNMESKIDLESSITELDQSRRPVAIKLPYTDAESATQIAEGTLRALRDLSLDEALELHSALRFWTYRWERPVLSWMEAGPSVWTSDEGYKHKSLGQKVAQIQAVLARRLSNIGELQQHLLRAGWQKGVAQWGVLGQGGQWAAVAGFDGSLPDTPLPSSLTRTLTEDVSGQNTRVVHRQEITSKLTDDFDSAEKEFERASSQMKDYSRRHQGANVLVQNKHGGGIFTDDPSFLAEWSVEAVSLVRRQLYRAANGRVRLPYETNWITSPTESSLQGEGAFQQQIMPQWASRSISTQDGSESNTVYRVTDLPLLATEVSELLDVMEDIMDIQKRRRLTKLRPMSWARRNWYILAASVPTGLWLIYRLAKAKAGRDLLSKFTHGIASFFNDRVRSPLMAIFTELWKGRESFSDHKARLEAIQGLKGMIRSWLDEAYPQMPLSQRIAMSESMDVSLIERKKEENMKTFYEINSVIRMSFIEMQFLKKEMMNALYAIDEMMSANDINMNLAAITPVIMLAYVQVRVFRFLYYALLKLGKSREETYASFRNILLDIERLLVMRANPPQSDANKPSVLGPNDLGMLMLLIHECRRILKSDYRRFSEGVIRSVSEDLAELAGERGKERIQHLVCHHMEKIALTCFY